MDGPPRGGSRGGQDQFKWDNVKLMSYKDRDCYLGASSQIGYLDKGGKWKRRDWYAHKSDQPDQSAAEFKHQLQVEKELKKREDEALINFRLGVKDDLTRDCTDIKQVLERVRAKYNSHCKAKPSSLTDFEIKELTQRDDAAQNIENLNEKQKQILQDQEQNDPERALQQADRVKGIGFESQHIVSSSSKHRNNSERDLLTQIKGAGAEDLKYLDQKKKLSLISFLQQKIASQKENSGDRKRDKKQKKGKSRDKSRKKEKKYERNREHKHRHRQRSQSGSDSDLFEIESNKYERNDDQVKKYRREKREKNKYKNRIRSRSRSSSNSKEREEKDCFDKI